MNTTRVLLLSLGPLLLSSTVQGAVSGFIEARLVISAACQVSNGQPGETMLGSGLLDFGQQGPTWANPLRSALDEDTAGALQVSCNPSVRAFTVSINGGSNADGSTRRLSNGRHLIPYQLSADPTGAASYGIGQQMNFSISSAAQIPIPIYGAVVANAKALPAGVYRDTLMVTLDW
ncbi:SCPU domain-containing protein [Pseudomonas sp. SDI]|uniref:Csu type fimbrial protein n=1 Tax=Pseudomonas sp. SDI TaxID=2170734 RepID=UPI000DE609CD|nr:spore coat U domain-containing protein [Pseudomonas sp. SDI]PWB32398.1 SCPU domain-containing protein [Pseudomonas sp. SDI]